MYTATVGKRGRGLHDGSKTKTMLQERLKIKYRRSSRKLAMALIQEKTGEGLEGERLRLAAGEGRG